MILKMNLNAAKAAAQKEFNPDYGLSNDLFVELVKAADPFNVDQIVLTAYKLGFMQGKKAKVKSK